MVRISRIFYGGYIPNNDLLVKLNVSRLHFKGVKTLYIPINSNNGLGKIKGATKKLGNNYSPVPVCCFKKSTRQLLWETKSKADGSYAFRNIAVDLECFVIAFDPDNQYNAVIQDKVIAK